MVDWLLHRLQIKSYSRRKFHQYFTLPSVLSVKCENFHCQAHISGFWKYRWSQTKTICRLRGWESHGKNAGFMSWDCLFINVIYIVDVWFILLESLCILPLSKLFSSEDRKRINHIKSSFYAHHFFWCASLDVSIGTLHMSDLQLSGALNHTTTMDWHL